MSGPFSVKSSRRYAWAPLVAGTALGGGVVTVLSVVALAMYATDLEGAGDVFFGTLVGMGLFIAVGAVQSLYWLLRAGWTEYEVLHGELRVVRFGKVANSWPCSKLEEVDVGDSWRLREVLPYGSGAIGGLPCLRVRADEGARLGARIDFRTYVGWPILLKTEDEVRQATAQIRASIDAWNSQ